MGNKNKPNIFSYLFVPHYDELSLFTMSYVLILLVVTNALSLKWGNQNLVFDSESFAALPIIIPFLAGLILCVYHAFSNRKKSLFEKKLMLIYAVMLNGFSGIWAGAYLIESSGNWQLSLFPIWNIINGFILIALLRGSTIDEDCIDDQDVSLIKLIFSTGIVTAIFLVCHYHLELAWAITLSICIVWTSNLNNVAGTLIERAKIIVLRV
jgi:hypothetical protein